MSSSISGAFANGPVVPFQPEDPDYETLRGELEVWAREEKEKKPGCQADKAVKCILESYQKKANYVNLMNLGLGTLPREIGKLSHLHELCLNGNALEALPLEIFGLKNLTHFSLSLNRFKGLPIEIGDLTQLVMLSLAENDLTFIPNAVGNFKELVELDLRRNRRLRALPLSLAELPKLRHIHVAGTGITKESLEVLPPKEREFFLQRCTFSIRG